LTFWKRKSYPMNLAFLGVFTALEAYSISVITSFYEVGINESMEYEDYG
jgi:FtsH-binding integral membrane protein